jgi:hypothetical protein
MAGKRGSEPAVDPLSFDVGGTDDDVKHLALR